jgi:hypothetical protein
MTLSHPERREEGGGGMLSKRIVVLSQKRKLEDVAAFLSKTSTPRKREDVA